MQCLTIDMVREFHPILRRDDRTSLEPGASRLDESVRKWAITFRSDQPTTGQNVAGDAGFGRSFRNRGIITAIYMSMSSASTRHRVWAFGQVWASPMVFAFGERTSCRRLENLPPERDTRRLEGHTTPAGVKQGVQRCLEDGFNSNNDCVRTIAHSSGNV